LNISTENKYARTSRRNYELLDKSLSKYKSKVSFLKQSHS